MNITRRTLYVAPLLAATAILYAPILVIAVFSFNSATRGMIWSGLSTEWYNKVWTDHGALSSLGNTARVVVLTTCASLVLGMGTGYFLSIASSRRFLVGSCLLFLPILTPDLVAALSQSMFYHSLGVPHGLATIVLSQTTFGAAYIGLFVSARLRAIEFHKFMIAAAALGATPSQSLRTVFLPLAIPAALAGACVVAALSAQDFLFAFFCGGPGTTTLSVRLYGMVKFGVPTTINVLFTLLIVCAFLLFVLSETLEMRKVK